MNSHTLPIRLVALLSSAVLTFFTMVPFTT